MTNNTFDASRTAWVSRGFEQFVAEYDEENDELDVLIIGSGYGGSIAADTISQYQKKTGADRNLQIVVLERGDEYLPGAFPANSTELAGHIRFGRKKEGLFDFRPGPDVSALVANGVGGGSLINAGVMIRPLPEVMQNGWPNLLNDIHALDKFFDRAEVLLGSHEQIGNSKSAVEVATKLDGHPLQKVKALRALGLGHQVSNASVTVANKDAQNSGNVFLNQCVRCGDCATGCNQNSKNSLDTNLLYRAHRRGVEIYSGATVLKIRRDDSDNFWLVETVFTNSKLRNQKGGATEIKTRNLVLAAGMLGSSEILLRSRTAELPFSDKLGKNCSTNGDTMITHYDAAHEANAVGHESKAPLEREVGPTICSVIDLRKDANDKLRGLLVEEMASPASMRRIFTELYATVNTMHALGDFDLASHHTEWPNNDIYEVSDDQIERTSLYAVMGDDGADGEIELVDENGEAFSNPLGESDDGVARIGWSGVADLPLFDQQFEALNELKGNAAGRIIPNPMWQLLPEDMALLTAIEHGPVVTVHPLGGCIMADSASDGVVNDLGQVFKSGNTPETYNGLVVLDGSIVPTALAANPSLTIAAIALRAACRLAEGDWDYELVATNGPLEDNWNNDIASELAAANGLGGESPTFPMIARPRLRETNHAFEPSATEIRVIERMAGRIPIRDADGNVNEWVVEMTLRSDDKRVNELTHPSEAPGNGVLTVSTNSSDEITRSRLRLFKPENFVTVHDQFKSSAEMELALEEAAEFSALITAGSLSVFERYRSCFLIRIICGLWAWLLNHGLRDIWQGMTSGSGSGPGISSLVKSAIALASHAGETRRLRYDLTIDQSLPPSISEDGTTGWHLRGDKEFSYTVKSNPWKQLMEMRVREFPGLVENGNKPILRLDPAYLARIRVPLIEITNQNDGVTALGEMASFLAYVTRLVLGIHGWSFRAPDEPESVEEPKRLPGNLVGLPDKVDHMIDLGSERPYGSKLPENHPDAQIPVKIKLTRYESGTSNQPPLIMMHGYSASGTTFAHNSVKNNYVSYFRHPDRNRDVWVLDFRTSCGMDDTRQHPWSFEQVAFRDIPEAVNYVVNATGAPKVDIIAHCMGAAMLSMGILYKSAPNEFPNQPLQDILPERIRRVALSQVSPLVVMSPANIFRGYVVQFLRELLPGTFEFNPGANATVDDRLLDRLLSTLPYPDAEFRIENPLQPCARTPWTGTRHRMDVLFGRVFDSTNLDEDVLNHIDDFFGPISIETVTQTINFARYSMITDVTGVNSFVGRETLFSRWQDIRTHSVNARDNGLADITTVFRTDKVFKDAGRSYQHKIVDNAGHQDGLIGNGPREETLKSINDFLIAGDGDLAPVETPEDSYVAYSPWIGPVITTEPDTFRSFRLGTRPTHLQAEAVLLIRVAINGDVISKPDGTLFTDSQADLDYMMDHGYLIKDEDLQIQRWGKYLFPPDTDGNAWLILVIFNESEALHETNQGYYAFQRNADHPDGGYLERVDPADWQRLEIGTADMLEIAKTHSFEKACQELEGDGTIIPAGTYRPMVRAMLNAVVNHGFSPPTSSPDDGSAPYPEEPLVSALDEMMRPIPDDDPVPVLMAGIAESAAVLDRLLDSNIDLRDGLVPDLPAATPNECSFLLTSCQYPAGMLDGSLAYHSYRDTLQRLGQLGDTTLPGGNSFIVPRFGVFTGDQIYADASAGMFDPSVKNGRFSLPYQNLLRFPYVRGVMRQLPSYMLLDDHEINDNWEPVSNPDLPGNEALRDSGVEGYTRYQRGMAPSNSNYSFVRNGFQFFMLDTRSGRDNRQPGVANTAELFDHQTLLDVEAWLNGAADTRPRFIVSPSMLLPRHRHAVQWNKPESSVNSDGWDGFPRSLYAILRLIAENQFENVVFLSGDEHFPNVTQLVLKERNNNTETVVHSIHTAAAYAPFAFANGRQDLQLDDEKIYFSTHPDLLVTSDQLDGSVTPSDYDYECAVTTGYPNLGDGMTYLRVWQDGTAWSLRAEFAGGTFAKTDLSAAGLPPFTP